MMKRKSDSNNGHVTGGWERVQRSHVPRKRGKLYHAWMVELWENIQKAVERDEADIAFKFPLKSLPAEVDKIRAVISRSAKKHKQKLATSTDNDWFYVEVTG